MIKAILFDMVGVLVFKKDNYIPETTDEKNAENIEKLFNHVDDQKLLMDIKEQLKLSDDEIKNATKIIPERFERFEDLWRLLPNLKKKYKLAVVNNGNAIAKKYWDDKFGFKEFDLFINSALQKVRKPDPEIYLITCKKLKVGPDECLFMDDSLENIDAANRLGMQTIWWNKDMSKETLLLQFKSHITHK